MTSLVTLFVSSPDTRSERRFDLQLSISRLKEKLELITGIPVRNQQLAIYNDDADSQPAKVLDDDQRPLGFYSPADFQVVDTNPSTTFTGQLTDLSGVDKFELSDEQYALRQDSVLAYKQRHKVGRFAEKVESTPAPAITVDIPIGSRCQVESTEPGLNKRGTVRYVGETNFGSAGGVWVGIEYDEPMGKNDGSVQGKRYFTCAPNFGVFMRPDKVRVGDFPVEDPFEDDENEM
ncbi:CAP Gly-rich domain-containing protein [Multifurca ochricompacta]|uniref:CAP Gly-rich domain-containing protein n=1 Tax=Multifurca ochricompacta TaxID=376703 RepID=A0AAD4QR56_9AGAM|nr:CAP Gly-rich domain-containing protein [Multifurca ochricompacta]